MVDLTDKEKDVFADYLQHSMNNPMVEFIRYLLGDDYLKFIDIMSGTTIKIPPAKTLEKDLESVKMYIYLMKYRFSEESIRAVSRMYGRTTLVVRRSVYKIARTLGTEDLLEGESLNNFLMNIKSVDVPNKEIVNNFDLEDNSGGDLDE